MATPEGGGDYTLPTKWQISKATLKHAFRLRRKQELMIPNDSRGVRWVSARKAAPAAVLEQRQFVNTLRRRAADTLGLTRHMVLETADEPAFSNADLDRMRRYVRAVAWLSMDGLKLMVEVSVFSDELEIPHATGVYTYAVQGRSGSDAQTK